MSFLVAVGFLTRIPVPVGRVGPEKLARSVAWFPTVGALVGLAVAGSYAGALTFLPPAPAAAIALAVGVLGTGAFHEDGLADAVDAIGGGRTADDVRRILKDPRHGSYGVLAMIFSILIRWSALATFDAVTAVAILPCVHAIARASAVGLMGFVPAAPVDGLGSAYRAGLRSSHAAFALSSAVVIGGLAAGIWVLPAIVLGVIAAVIVGRLAMAKLGGISGDFLGATEQIAEASILLMGAAVATNSWTAAAWWR